MLRADEDGRMLFLHNEFCNIFPSVNGTEKPAICLTKFFNFVQFNNKKQLLQYKVKYDKTIKI